MNILPALLTNTPRLSIVVYIDVACERLVEVFDDVS